MSNIARHGKVHSFPTETDADNPLSISIDIDVLADRIAMTFEDNGRPFDVERRRRRLSISLWNSCGPAVSALTLIKSFSHNIDIAHGRGQSCHRRLHALDPAKRQGTRNACA